MEGCLSGLSMLLCTVELEPGTTRVYQKAQSLKVYVPNCEPAGPDIFLSF